MSETKTRDLNAKTPTWRAIVVNGAILCVLAAIILPAVEHNMAGRRRRACAWTLFSLGKAIRAYSNDFDRRYPTPHKWCDLLAEYADLNEASFQCPSNKKARCSYALNPNADPNGPADMVVLFETKGGWNDYGGVELITAENHSGRGCNVLFNDGHVTFERLENFPSLIWLVGPPNSSAKVPASGNRRRPANDYLPARGKDRNER